MKIVQYLIVSVLLCGTTSGCSTWGKLNGTEKGAVIGGGGGALIGSSVGGTGGALLGGAGGAVAGGLIGHEMDHRKKK